MKTSLIILVVILVVCLLFSIPVWSYKGKAASLGTGPMVKINTFQMIQIITGSLKID